MAKRALIVDDSKSARLTLARILEKYAIEVDAAESAEEAIEYLGTHRPDAIFMDHMMPGMDGLQAVQAIKNNPRTATIPIMMYTSQEGEVYVGQARALGAIGVLPKQIKPADVTKVLYQLNLAEDRRSGVAEDAHVQVLEPAPHTGPLREQLNELRRMVLAGFDSQGDRLLADMRTVLQELRPIAAKPAAARSAWLPWALAAVLAGACAALAGLYWQQGPRLTAVEQDVAQLKAAATAGAGVARPPITPEAAAAPAAAAPATDSAADAAPARVSARPIIQAVPYGVEPFSGSRLDAIRQLFDRLTAQGFQGSVEIRNYSGRFCLVGNATDGYSLAPDDLPYSRCDLVTGARDDSAAGVMRIPVVLADLMGTVRAGSHDQIHVQVTGGEGSTLAAYPPVSDTLTAGEWNRAAGANNRIEIRVR
ncbi:MAG TPA: response regulator [Steroidobacteraceae bacterium]|nr:response regulator [Steroidobacteraceae bacterium]